MDGSGSFSRYSENGIISIRNILRTVVMASPISDASDSISALNSVLPTIDSVRRIISSDISSVFPASSAPAIARRIRSSRRLGSEPFPVERGLYQTALPHVMLAFTGEQSFSQQNFRAL